MVFVPATNVLRVAIVQELFNQQVINTLYFRNDLGWTLTDAGALAADLIVWWAGTLGPHMSTSISLERIEMRDLTTQDGLVLVTPVPVPTAGTLGGDVLPNNVAFCLSLRTGLAGRSRRGRNYIAGLRALDVVGNELSETRSDGLRGAYEFLPPIAASNNATWGVLSTVEDGQPRIQGLYTVITSVIYVNRTVDTQRRRLPGTGA